AGRPVPAGRVHHILVVRRGQGPDLCAGDSGRHVRHGRLRPAGPAAPADARAAPRLPSLCVTMLSLIAQTAPCTSWGLFWRDAGLGAAFAGMVRSWYSGDVFFPSGVSMPPKLTSELQQAVQQSKDAGPVRVVDPATNTAYY